MLLTLEGLSQESALHLNSILNTFITEDWQPFSLQALLPHINCCFSGETVEEIVERLGQLQSTKDKSIASWATKTLETLSKMSPTSLKVTLELMRRGRQSTFKECFRMECTLAANMLDRVPDLYEGISAKLVRKLPTAQWKPSTLELVKLDFIKDLFVSTKDTPRVAFLSTSSDDYSEYPHVANGLPTTPQLQAMIQANQHLESWDAICQAILDECHNKQGVFEKLQLIRQELSIPK